MRNEKAVIITECSDNNDDSNDTKDRKRVGLWVGLDYEWEDKEGKAMHKSVNQVFVFL